MGFGVTAIALGWRACGAGVFELYAGLRVVEDSLMCGSFSTRGIFVGRVGCDRCLGLGFGYIGLALGWWICGRVVWGGCRCVVCILILVCVFSYGV